MISCSNKLNSPAPVIAGNNLNVNPSFNFLYPTAKQKKLVYVEQRAESSFEHGVPYRLELVFTISAWVQRVMFTDGCCKMCMVRILQSQLGVGHIAI